MGMTTLLTLAAMFSAIATTTPRVSYSSKLDIWMVFCVIFVFGTLMEFSLLIFLQKQVFGPKVILPSWKNLLCRPKATSTLTLGSVYRKRRHSIPADEMGPTPNNANGGSQVRQLLLPYYLQLRYQYYTVWKLRKRHSHY